MLLGLITVNIVHGKGKLLIYSWEIGLGTIILSFAHCLPKFKCGYFGLLEGLNRKAGSANIQSCIYAALYPNDVDSCNTSRMAGHVNDVGG